MTESSGELVIDLNEMARKIREEGYEPTDEELKAHLLKLRQTRTVRVQARKAETAVVKPMGANDILALFKPKES